MPKPAFGISSKPPLKVLLPDMLQHFGLGAITLVIPRLVAEASGADEVLTARYLSLAMLAVGVATLLQAWGRRGVGSGYLLPACFTGIYAAPALAVASQQGLAAVAGLSIIAGLTELGLSLALRRIRAFFPSEVIGFVIFMIGLGWGLLGLKLMTGLVGRPHGSAEGILALLTLATTIGVSLWGPKTLRPLAVLVGMVSGCTASLLAYLLGGPEAVSVPALHTTGFVWPLIRPEFHAMFLPAFLLGAVASFIRCSGDVVASHLVSDANWKRTSAKTLSAGTFAAGLGTIFAGCLGTLPPNTNSGSIGLVAANGIASRKVAQGVGLTWIALAFIPGGSSLLEAVPPGVFGAAICFTGAFVIRAGINVITQRLLDNRRTITIGLALLLGLSFDELITKLGLPPSLKMTFASSLLTAVAVALLLNALLRLGLKRSVSQEWSTSDGAAKLHEFIEDCGAQWGARVDLIRRAKDFLEEFSQAAPALVTSGQPVSIRADYDEVSLRFDIQWRGRTAPDGNKPMTLELDDMDDSFEASTAVTLMKHRTDSLTWSEVSPEIHRAVAVLDDH